MTDEQELEKLIKRRGDVRAKQMARLHAGSATRARTTTSNAEASRLNEQIMHLRDRIKTASNGVPIAVD